MSSHIHINHKTHHEIDTSTYTVYISGAFEFIVATTNNFRLTNMTRNVIQLQSNRTRMVENIVIVKTGRSSVFN